VDTKDKVVQQLDEILALVQTLFQSVADKPG
jgi:hypothetical protein